MSLLGSGVDKNGAGIAHAELGIRSQRDMLHGSSRVEYLRAVRGRCGVLGAAVFAAVAHDDPKLATLRTDDEGRPILQYEHQE